MLEFKLKTLARRYAETQDGKWLNDFNWQTVEVITVSKLPGDVVGMYTLGWIVLLDTNVEIIFSTYIHELRHRWQWKRNKIRYIVGKLIRPLIERDADRETEKADNWLAEYRKEHRI